MPIGNPIRKQNESRMVSVLATSGQTVFTVQGGYRINQISVFRNGVRLSPADDYTAGDGSTVTLNDGANVNDRIDFHIFDTFTVQNAIIGAASTQTINGDLVLNGKLFGQLDVPSINLTGIITATELDLNGKGDISGDLKVTGISTFTNVDAAGIVTARQGLRINANGLNVTGVSTFASDVSIADKIVHTGDVNTAIRFPSADTISFETAGTERLSIESNGTFAFGNVTPGGNPAAKNVFLCIGDSDSGIVQDGDGQIEIFANDTEIVNFNAVDGSTFTGNITIPDKIIHSGDTNTSIRFPAADTFTVETGGSERIRVDSSGRILQGSSTGRNTALMAAQATYQLEGVGSNASNFSIFCNSNGTAAGGIEFGKTRGTSNGGTTIVASGDDLGHISFEGSDGSAQRVAARINVQVDGTPGSSDMPGRIRFLTTPDGSASEVERMRIDSGGRVIIGGTSNSASSHADELQIINTSAQGGLSIITADNTQGNIYFGHSGGTADGRIEYNHVADYMRFYTGNNERLRVDSSGHLKIGATANRDLGGLSVQRLHIEGTDGGGSGIGIVNNQNSTGYPSIRFGKSRGTSVGSNTVVQSGDPLGGIIFCGADGTDMVSIGAQILAEVADTPGSNDMPTRLQFFTTADGASTSTERLRITQDGHLVIGGDSNNTFAGLQRLDIFNTSTADDYHGSLIRLISKNAAGNSTASYDIVKYKEGTVSHNNNESSGSINFYAGGATRLQVLSTGDINVNDGDVVLASGHGISFAATADGASNPYFSEILDDYEEGTFTPTWSASSATFAYSQQYGWYTKIGDTVTFHIYLQGYASSIISGNSGNPLSVTGLPFSSKNVNRYYPPVTIGRTYRMDIDSDMRIYAYINQGTTEVKLILEQDDTTGSMMSVGRLDTNTCEILLSGHYKITT